MLLKPRIHKENWSKAIRQIIFRFCKVEILFSRLGELLIQKN